MNFSKLIKSLEVSEGTLLPVDFEVKGISCNSREIRPDFVFVAIKGVNTDGNKFIEQAILNGAKGVVFKPEGDGFASYSKSHKPEGDGFASDRGRNARGNVETQLGSTYSYSAIGGADGQSRKSSSPGIKIKEKNKIVFIEVGDDRKALSQLARAFYGNSSAKMKIIGVTGTNGKTTITYLLESILKECGKTVGVIGTINYRFGDKIISAQNTTPGALELESIFDQMRGAGVNYAVMEVSSHALVQDRVSQINFSSAIFTNLTQDHLDYHKDMENYFLAKSKLFLGPRSQNLAIINNDDPYGLRIKQFFQGKVVTYGIDSACDVQAKILKMDLSSSEFFLQIKNWGEVFKVNLIGRHNIYNVLAAFSWAFAEGLDLDKVKAALENFSFVPGRLERVDSGKEIFSVFVDYAHTPDALKNVLSALRQISSKRLIVVFGCGGDRDKAKRPKMGKVASELADYVIITNDNSRSEEPREIIEDIKSGIKKDNFSVILERLEAIKKSLSLAKNGDIVLVAGKGHENYQIFKNKTLYFDDREAVRESLKELGA